MTRKYKRHLFLTACPVLLFLLSPAAFGQDKKSIDSIENALHQFEITPSTSTSNDTVKARLIYQLGKHYYGNDFEKASKYANQLLEFSNKIGYQWGVPKALELQANIADYNGDYNRALKLFFRALTLYKQKGSKSEIINVQNNIGVTYAKKGIYTEGLKYLLQGLETAKKVNDIEGLVSTYNNIGIVCKIQGKPEQALQYYLKCLALQLAHHGGYSISFTYQNIGEIYRNKGDYGKALEYFELGLKYAKTENNPSSVANNYSSIGSVYIDKKIFDKALENHLIALAIREKMQDGYGMFTSYVSLGNIYHQIGENQKALAFTQKAYELVKGRGELDMMAEVYRQFSEINATLGNYKAAYQNHQLYKQFNDSVFNAENQKKFTEQQLNFDFKNIQEQKDRKAKAALQTQKNIRNYTVIMLSLIALLIILWLVKRHRRNTQALQTENENIQLRNELLAIESKREKEKLQENLDFNQRELATTTLYLFQKNEMLTELKQEFESLSEAVPKKQLDKIRSTIQNNLYVDADWDRFKLHFEQVHPDFFKSLHENNPNLTVYEMRLCAYLHMKLSTKEIASLLNIEPASVFTAKMRLNKKLNIADNTPSNLPDE
jgi:tetratricopeptide (TPR) repeat protein